MHFFTLYGHILFDITLLKYLNFIEEISYTNFAEVNIRQSC